MGPFQKAKPYEALISATLEEEPGREEEEGSIQRDCPMSAQKRRVFIWSKAIPTTGLKANKVARG